MKKLILFLAAFLHISAVAIAQTNEQKQFPAGIIYGPKSAYKIDAPQNWVLDNKSGISIGLPCVLYINGYTWENSPVIMYAKIASVNFENIDSFIAFAVNEFKKEDTNFFYQQLKTGTIDSSRYIIMDYRGGPYNSYERVFYIQMKRAVGYVVFSARNEDDFKKYSDAIFGIIDSYRYRPEYINYEGRNKKPAL
ncbi:MAG TPA: hypothetical protein VI461_15890 [Chitinophagaceae bacterium]|nr:hypothetical protein [Chitinophagaceae bacterium]